MNIIIKTQHFNSLYTIMYFTSFKFTIIIMVYVNNYNSIEM